MMNKTLLLGCAIFLTSCANSVESKYLACGSNASADEILQLILKEKKCLACLKDEADIELKNCPNDVALNRMAMGVSIRTKMKSDVILKYYESITSSDTLTAGEIAAVAFYYREKGDYENAISNYKKSLLQQEDPFVRFSLATALNQTQQKTEAVASLKKILSYSYPLAKATDTGLSIKKTDVLFDDASSLLADIYMSLDQQAEAEAAYRNLVSAYDEHEFHYPDYLLMLSRFLGATSDPTKVKESAEIEARANSLLLRDTESMRQHRQQIENSWLRKE